MGSRKHVFSLFLRIAVLLFVIKAINSTDDYVKDLKRKCSKTKRPFFCMTLRLAQFVQDFDYDGPHNSAVKIVKIKRQEVDTSDILPRPRYISNDSETDKFIKFLQRKLLDFLSTHGIAFEVPTGVRVVQGRSLDDVSDQDSEEDSSIDKQVHHLIPHHKHKVKKEEKKFLLWFIPIVLLIKMYFIKVALHTILFGTVVIKFLIFKGAIWLHYLMYEVKRVSTKEGLVKELWNGLWQKKMDSGSVYNEYGGINATWIPPN
ncbi:uncharacterized protein LOC126741929 [Anthonomus grandis grandis]|uniref:uncharacterized protein LOC126741929 n=1 Tax=Anthonomus grandis grandis TaxID=2921223 RepID=UPI0021651065|nr:uncharacterized protein LOC126741929 [Anthonomus grandis grandis]